MRRSPAFLEPPPFPIAATLRLNRPHLVRPSAVAGGFGRRHRGELIRHLLDALSSCPTPPRAGRRRARLGEISMCAGNTPCSSIAARAALLIGTPCSAEGTYLIHQCVRCPPGDHGRDGALGGRLRDRLGGTKRLVPLQLLGDRLCVANRSCSFFTYGRTIAAVAAHGVARFFRRRAM